MPKAMLSSLHNGLEIAFLIALLSAYLRNRKLTGLISPLKWGALAAILASLGLTYMGISLLNREAVELIANGSAVLFTIALIAWLGLTTDQPPEQNSGKVAISFFVFLATLTLLVIPGLDIGLTQSKVFIGNDGFSGGQLAAGLLILTVAILAGVTLYKVTTNTEAKWISRATLLSLFILLVRNATATVQVMLVKRMIPMTDWLFRVIVPLVNNYAAFFYALLVVAATVVLIAVREWRHREPAFEVLLNPAEKRKTKAAARRMAKLFALIAVLLMLVILNDGASNVLAKRPIQLVPATPVIAENGLIKIPGETVADGNLHRFSLAVETTAVRFIVVYKGSDIYGVGLDACSFCGVAGYRQEKENIICNRCSAAINKTTIGFPGGCNPVPLENHKEGNFVVIPAEDIIAAKSMFAQ